MGGEKGAQSSSTQHEYSSCVGQTLCLFLTFIKEQFGVSLKRICPFKAGVHVKAVLTSLNTAFLPISRSRFKRH